MYTVRRKMRYYGILILTQLTFLLIFWNLFHRWGYSFLWSPDGVLQHFTAFQYTSLYWVDAVKRLLHGQIPSSFMNYAIGQGRDMLLTLNTYDFTEPVTVACSVFFRKNLMCGYEVMILAKNLLTGIFFSEYCFARKNWKESGVLCGSITYTFSSYAMILCLRHPNFFDGIYLLPLLLWGVEECIQKGNGKVLTGAVIISILSNYYVFYINGIITVGYIFARVFCSKETGREKWKKICILLSKGITGLCLSGTVLLPSVYAFVTNSRLGQRTGYAKSLLFYSQEFYVKALKNLFQIAEAGHYTFTGIPILGVICLILLSGTKEGQKLAVGIGSVLILLGMPVAGIIMNGFGYARNLWGYMVYFLFSCSIASGYEKMKRISFGKAIILCTIVGGYGIYYVIRGEKGRMAVILLLSCLFIFICRYGKMREGFYTAVCVGLTISNTCIAVFDYYSPLVNNHVSKYIKEEAASDIYNEGVFGFAKLLEGSEAKEFYRIEKKQLGQNQELNEKFRGTTYWWSIMPEMESAFYRDLELNTLKQNCNFKGLDGRTNLCALASVKYYISDTENSSMVPYGFKKMKETGKYVLYENEETLPLMYVYRKLIDPMFYESASPVEKQALLLKGALSCKFADDLTDSTFFLEKPDTGIKEVVYEVTTGPDISLSENHISIEKDKASMTLEFWKNKDCEVYLWFEDTELISDKGEVTLTASVKGSQGKKEASFQNALNNWAVPRSGMTINLGSSGEGKMEVSMLFSKKGEIRFKKLHVLEYSMNEYLEDVKELKSIPVAKQKVEDGNVCGQVDLETAAVLQVALPYSCGWEAFVDEEKTRIYPTGGMYMGLMLSPGKHNIRMVYHTPYEREGTCLTLATAVILLAGSWKKRKSIYCKY